MDKVIVFTRPDGGITVRIPCVEAMRETDTEDEFILRLAADSKQKAVDNPRIILRSEIPMDRTFRNAWNVQAGKIGHNISKCKAIAHDKRRDVRAKELAPLDIEATIPTKAAQAEAARQIIRDKYAAIQTQIDSAIDVPTLKSIVDALP